MFEIIRCEPKSDILVVTPLRVKDDIEKCVQKLIETNDVSFSWVSYKSEANIPTNTELGMLEWKKSYELPKYIIKIDNDINPDDHFLDALYNRAEFTDNRVAYVYPSFRYFKEDGQVLWNLEASPFNISYLLKQNYITSMSLIKTSYLEQIGGFVKDEKYQRLLDWALWLKFYYFGFIGEPEPSAWFSSTIKLGDVSSGTREEYIEKACNIMQDFCLPIIKKEGATL